MFVLHLIQFSPFIVILVLHAAIVTILIYLVQLLCHLSRCLFEWNEMFLLLLNICMRNAVTDSKLYHGEKYLMTESMINSYTWQMNLTVRNLQKSDFGQYVCSSDNALGKSDAPIRLQGEKMTGKLIFLICTFFFTSNSLIYGITIVSSSRLYFNAKTFFILYCYCCLLLLFLFMILWKWK
jgi:hypothetical protein